MKMKTSIWIMILLAFAISHGFAQDERKQVREGVKEYQNDKYTEAEVRFRKALDSRPELYEAEYDIANSLFKQKKYEEAAAEYEKLIDKNSNPEQRADLYHNLGNSHVMANQLDKGIEAYKNSLRIRPDDEDTRYNLAYALEKMKQEQQQQKDQNKDQDKKDDQKDKDKDKQKQDQQDKNKDEKKDQDQKQDQQQQPQDKKEDKQQEQPKPEINKQDAEQMLNAVQNQEKEVKEKVDKKKAVAKPVRTEKDW